MQRVHHRLPEDLVTWLDEQADNPGGPWSRSLLIRQAILWVKKELPKNPELRAWWPVKEREEEP